MRAKALVGLAWGALCLLQQISYGQEAIYDNAVGYAGVFSGRTDPVLVLGQDPLPAAAAGSASAADASCCPDPCDWTVFGEFLYLRPGNDRVPIAVPINGAIVPPVDGIVVQAGETATADVGFQPGFRVGMSRAWDECSRVGVCYTRFEGVNNSAVATTAPLVLRSAVSHPGTYAAPTDFLDAAARYDIQFQLADLDYRRIWLSGDQYVVNYVVGARYAHLGQTLNAISSNSTVIETVDTQVLFDGAGIRVGLEGERHAACSGWMIYGSGMASFLGGTFRGDFLQVTNAAGAIPQVVNGWKDDRVVSILEIEAGVGWVSESGCLRLKGGYLVSGWFNAPTTDRFIRSVHRNRVIGVDDTLTFDGVSLRAEVRF